MFIRTDTNYIATKYMILNSSCWHSGVYFTGRVFKEVVKSVSSRNKHMRLSDSTEHKVVGNSPIVEWRCHLAEGTFNLAIDRFLMSPAAFCIREKHHIHCLDIQKLPLNKHNYPHLQRTNFCGLSCQYSV